MAIQITLKADEYQDLLANNDKLAEEYESDPNREGCYVLTSAVGYESPQEVAGLKGALHKERQLNKEGPATHAEKKALGKVLKQLEDVTAEKEQATEAFQQQLTDLQTQMADLSSNLVAEKTTNAVNTAVAQHRGTPGLQAYLQGGRVKTDPDTGQPVPIDPETKAPILGADGSPLSVSDYVAALRKNAYSNTPEADSLAGMFLAPASSGGGTPPGAGGNGGGIPPANMRRSQMSARQKVDYVKTHGDAAFQSLRS